MKFLRKFNFEKYDMMCKYLKQYAGCSKMAKSVCLYSAKKFLKRSVSEKATSWLFEREHSNFYIVRNYRLYFVEKSYKKELIFRAMIVHKK